MSRLGLSNLFTRIGLNQFKSLSQEFQTACENAYGAPCRTEIKLLKQPEVYTTFMLDDDVMQDLADQNRAQEILKTDNFDDISAEIWQQARYAKIVVRPVNENDAPSHAFATAEFKGRLARTATFYMQGGDKTEQAMADLRQSHRLMRASDGYESNGVQSASAFMAVAGTLGSHAQGIASKVLAARGNRFDI
jgi:hypothetical protein